MPFEFPFQLQFHWCYVKELNNRLVTTGNQQLTIGSEAAAVCTLSEMTECLQRLNCSVINNFNLQSATHFVPNLQYLTEVINNL